MNEHGFFYDWVVVQVISIGCVCIEGKFQPYKLIGDAVCPVKPKIYSPFEGGNASLFGNETDWNFIQSSNIICIEMTFGILKGKWRLIIKRYEKPLKNLFNILATCIVLHNLYIANNEGIVNE